MIFTVGCERETKMDLSSLDDETMLERISDIAFSELEQNADNLASLDEPYKTVAIIYGAQGIIDNGGFRYFFENDWPNNPDYSVFADAYARIERTEAADAIREAVATFDFKNPELYVNKRRAFMNSRYNKNTFSVDGWNDCVCGDDQVWVNLAKWVRENY